MKTATAVLHLYAPWVHSLKEKRMLVKSIIAKTQNKFNISIAEVDEMDTHQLIVIGMACVSNNASVSQEMIEQVIRFIENQTEAEITSIDKDFF